MEPHATDTHSETHTEAHRPQRNFLVSYKLIMGCVPAGVENQRWLTSLYIPASHTNVFPRSHERTVCFPPLGGRDGGGKFATRKQLTRTSFHVCTVFLSFWRRGRSRGGGISEHVAAEKCGDGVRIKRDKERHWEEEKKERSAESKKITSPKQCYCPENSLTQQKPSSLHQEVWVC